MRDFLWVRLFLNLKLNSSRNLQLCISTIWVKLLHTFSYEILVRRPMDYKFLISLHAAVSIFLFKQSRRLSHKQSSRLSVLDVKMGHTLLSLLGFLLLNLLYRGQAQDAVLTIEPNWTVFFPGESVTFKCDLTGGKGSDWFYSIQRDGREFISYGKYESFKLPSLASGYTGEYQCFFLHGGSTKISNKIYLTVSDTPQAVLSVSPSWPSPGASVTLNCRVDHPSAGWSFSWYKAVPRLSGNSYRYELLAGSENGTEQHLFIIDGQTHTAGYVCRAGRGDPVFYCWYSTPKFVWSGDMNSAASLTVSPDSVQHFPKTPVSLSCEGNSTEWRVMRFSKSDNLYPCSSWGTMTGSTCTISRSWLSGVYWCESETGQFSNAVNITKDDGEIILVSPVRPVAEGRPVTLSCKFKTGTVYNVDFYKNDKLIQNDTRRELTISAVSKSDEGFYKCKRRDSADGWTSPESWFSVKSEYGPGTFPVLLIVGLLCGVSLIILLLLFLYLYRKSKDSCYSRSQRTNQCPATDHMINQDETNQREYASVVQDFSSDNACLYETIRDPEEPANDESTDATYSVLELKNISKKGKKNELEDCVSSHVQMASAAGKSSPAPF